MTRVRITTSMYVNTEGDVKDLAGDIDYTLSTLCNKEDWILSHLSIDEVDPPKDMNLLLFFPKSSENIWISHILYHLKLPCISNIEVGEDTSITCHIQVRVSDIQEAREMLSNLLRPYIIPNCLNISSLIHGEETRYNWFLS